MSMDQAEIRLNGSPVFPAVSLKRKREEIADSDSENEELASDQEFGWAGQDDASNTDELLI